MGVFSGAASRAEGPARVELHATQFLWSWRHTWLQHASCSMCKVSLNAHVSMLKPAGEKWRTISIDASILTLFFDLFEA